jgi:hypothetical protein
MRQLLGRVRHSRWVLDDVVRIPPLLRGLLKRQLGGVRDMTLLLRGGEWVCLLLHRDLHGALS